MPLIQGEFFIPSHRYAVVGFTAEYIADIYIKEKKVYIVLHLVYDSKERVQFLKNPCFHLVTLEVIKKFCFFLLGKITYASRRMTSKEREILMH